MTNTDNFFTVFFFTEVCTHWSICLFLLLSSLSSLLHFSFRVRIPLVLASLCWYPFCRHHLELNAHQKQFLWVCYLRLEGTSLIITKCRTSALACFQRLNHFKESVLIFLCKILLKEYFEIDISCLDIVIKLLQHNEVETWY